MKSLSPSAVEKMIFVIRGQKVMLDTDLAELYRVETKTLNRSVRRNIERFPEDFMFQLTSDEYEILRCQIGTLRFDHGRHRKYLPLAFTEQGVAMLAGVLNSPQAIRVNLAIMRTFVRLRQALLQECLSDRLSNLEKGTDQLFRIVFERLDTLEQDIPDLPAKRRKIGIHQD
ncbi:MAG: ORF6N domain-containing protein [Bdellovibrionota bacterium]